MNLKYRPWAALALLAAVLVAGCASSPEAPTQAQITDEVAVQATILSVDRATRELTLQRGDGSQVVVVAGHEVRNFDQIQAGNKVSARYIVSLNARRLAPDEPDTAPRAGLTAARAGLGQAPAGAIGAGVTMTVVVKSVDPRQHVVVFTDPEGRITPSRPSATRADDSSPACSPATGWSWSTERHWCWR